MLLVSTQSMRGTSMPTQFRVTTKCCWIMIPHRILPTTQSTMASLQVAHNVFAKCMDVSQRPEVNIGEGEVPSRLWDRPPSRTNFDVSPNTSCPPYIVPKFMQVHMTSLINKRQAAWSQTRLVAQQQFAVRSHAFCLPTNTFQEQTHLTMLITWPFSSKVNNPGSIGGTPCRGQ